GWNSRQPSRRSSTCSCSPACVSRRWSDFRRTLSTTRSSCPGKPRSCRLACRAPTISLSRLPVRCPAGRLGYMADVTQILDAIEHGDPQAAEQLLPLVYDELRKLAAQKLAQEKPGQTLQATALVHEAYLRLVDTERARQW